MLVLQKNQLEDYEDEIDDLVGQFEAYLSTKITKQSDEEWWKVVSDLRYDDIDYCLIKYEELVTRGTKDISNYLYLISAIKRSGLVDKISKKSGIVRNLLRSNNIIYEFGQYRFDINDQTLNLCEKNAEAFAFGYGILDLAQKVTNQIYYSYYKVFIFLF